MDKIVFMSGVCLVLTGIAIHSESSNMLFVAIGFGLGNFIIGIMDFLNGER